MPEYRQLIGSVVWHFRRDCSAWPSQNFGVLGNPVDGEICTECTCLGVLHRTCPVIVNNNLCGLEPIRNSDGLYYCPVGHRTRLDFRLQGQANGRKAGRQGVGRTLRDGG